MRTSKYSLLAPLLRRYDPLNPFKPLTPRPPTRPPLGYAPVAVASAGARTKPASALSRVRRPEERSSSHRFLCG